MARPRNGTTANLESAMALLLQNQVQFLSHLTEDRQRFLRIEDELGQIKTLLLQHDQILKNHDQNLKSQEQILRDLPEAIRQKIGFKPK